MKRELKECFGECPARIVAGFTPHPDEEGTESSTLLFTLHRWRVGFTPHPDEEGTERIPDEAIDNV